MTGRATGGRAPVLIGGEMPAFSDVRAGGAAPAGGPLLTHLATAVAAARGAVAGGSAAAGGGRQ
ncbi:MAG TPA: hypothetical protein VNV66_19400, partial [Pilimelia sp.]|nr:hypothetical protein [Pilimelia sp.]